MAQTRPSPTLSRGFTRLGRFLAPYDIEPFYNQRRRHSTLGQISPAAFERQAVA